MFGSEKGQNTSLTFKVGAATPRRAEHQAQPKQFAALCLPLPEEDSQGAVNSEKSTGSRLMFYSG